MYFKWALGKLSVETNDIEEKKRVKRIKNEEEIKNNEEKTG